ncbi:MAG: hypothetical protein BroJett038_24520 [Chloroflexota bacterium]|nr:MAG: hypothetical protein BroJett038_24520 [Chloroflexota bacterium]
MDIEKLKAAGFVETTYPGQHGVFLTKRMPIQDMPYAREHIVDNEIVCETDTAVVEFVPDPLFPGGGVQMTVAQCDYIEEAVAVSSEEGQALLRDAGVVC